MIIINLLKLSNNHINFDKNKIDHILIYEFLRFLIKKMKKEGKYKYKEHQRILSLTELQKFSKFYKFSMNLVFNNPFIKIYPNFIELSPYKELNKFYAFDRNEFGNMFLRYYLSETELKTILKKIYKTDSITFKKFKMLYALLQKTIPNTFINYSEETIGKFFNLDKSTINKNLRKLTTDRYYTFLINTYSKKELIERSYYDETINPNQAFTCHIFNNKLENLKVNIYLMGSQVIPSDINLKLFKQFDNYKNGRITKTILMNKKINMSSTKGNYKKYIKNINKHLYIKYMPDFIRSEVLINKKYADYSNNYIESFFISITDNKQEYNYNELIKYGNLDNLKYIKIKAKRYDIAELKINLLLILNFILKEILNEKNKNLIIKVLKEGNIKLLKRNLYYIKSNTKDLSIIDSINRFFKLIKKLIQLEKKTDKTISEEDILNSNFIEYVLLNYVKKYSLTKYKSTKNKKFVSTMEINFQKKKLYIKKNIKVFVENKLKTNIKKVLKFLLNYGYTLNELQHNFLKIFISNYKIIQQYLKGDNMITTGLFLKNACCTKNFVSCNDTNTINNLENNVKYYNIKNVFCNDFDTTNNLENNAEYNNIIINSKNNEILKIEKLKSEIKKEK